MNMLCVIGKTELDVLRPMPDCDTNNSKDMNKYINQLIEMYPDAAAICAHQDAQGVLTMKGIKKVRDERTKHIILLPGGMHKGVHMLTYAGQHSYSENLLMPIAVDHLEFTKIEARPVDLEQDKADNHRKLQHAVALACKYLLLKKYGTETSAKRMHRAVQGNAADETMFNYNLQVGEQGLKWLFSTRASQGVKMDECMNWMTFLAYANHKTGYNQVAIIRAISRYCTHKAIRELICYQQTVNQNGRVGTDFHIDDHIEAVNKDVQSFADKSDTPANVMVYTEYQEIMKHIDSRYRELWGVDNETLLQERSSFVTTCRSIVQWMEEQIEEHKDNPSKNPFNGKIIYGDIDDYRRQRPWEHIKKCHDGEAAPIGWSQFRPKSWQVYAERYIHKHMYDVGQHNNDVSDEESE